jgi:acetylornithine deacetylase/succinyl-diaminopimelate desuccinylase-like protein
MSDIVMDLQTLIRQPSVSAKQEGLSDCAGLVAHIMRRAGIKTELLYLEDLEAMAVAGPLAPPIVYGEVKSKSNPNAKTILFYNHYDVQPVEPVELWNVHPFSGKVEGNYIFGRGAADDKGELIARIKAVEYYLKKSGDVPCNVKFLVEGEEEIGSTHLSEFLNLYSNKFNCDGIIWESGFVDTNSRAIISLGQKGILSVEIGVNGPSRDAHSSLASLIENPTWKLVRILDSLRDNSGKILIKGWYKEVKDFTNEEVSLMNKELFDEEALKEEYGVTRFINDAKGIDVKKAFAGKPTCNISGLVAGYMEHSKTVLPSKALAKLDFRLVPDMVPEIQFNRLQEHLKEHGFAGKNEDSVTDACATEIRFVEGEPASRTPVTHPLVNIVRDAAIKVYGDAIINISSAGTGPMYYFDKMLHVPCVCIGGTDLSNRSHSPNEYMRIDRLNKTIKCIAVILETFA